MRNILAAVICISVFVPSVLGLQSAQQGLSRQDIQRLADIQKELLEIDRLTKGIERVMGPEYLVVLKDPPGSYILFVKQTDFEVGLDFLHVMGRVSDADYNRQKQGTVAESAKNKKELRQNLQTLDDRASRLKEEAAVIHTRYTPGGQPGSGGAGSGSRPATWNLSGKWRANGDSTYDIEQSGAAVTWFAHSDKPKVFAHDFTGKIEGDVISGTFTDQPGNEVPAQRGTLRVHVDDACHLSLLSSSVPFGVRNWTREPCPKTPKPD